LKEKYKEKQKTKRSKNGINDINVELRGEKSNLEFEYFEVSQYVSESQWTFFYGAPFIGHFIIWLDIFFW